MYLVTGGGNGIGRATALHLARHGAKVTVADIDLEAANETITLAVGEGTPQKMLHAVAADVRDAEARERLRDRDLLLASHRRARALLAVAQRRVEDDEALALRRR